jgi:hypothetical protein
MAINSYFGTPLSKEKYQVNIPYLVLTSKDDFDAYIKYASQGAASSPDEMRQFIGVYNPQLNLQTFQAMVDKWSVADIKARKEG